VLGENYREVFRIINEITREPCEDPVGKVLQTGNIVVAFAQEYAVKALLDNAGTQFDPQVVKVFVERVLGKPQEGPLQKGPVHGY